MDNLIVNYIDEKLSFNCIVIKKACPDGFIIEVIHKTKDDKRFSFAQKFDFAKPFIIDNFISQAEQSITRYIDNG